MDTYEIKKILNFITPCNYHYKYVKARDQLKEIDITKLPFVCVIHTEPLKTKLGHWVGLIAFDKGG